MTKPKKYAHVTDIQKVGSDKMVAAQIDVGDHGEAIQVIGENLDECVRRSVIVCRALCDAHAKGEI